LESTYSSNVRRTAFRVAPCDVATIAAARIVPHNILILY